MGTTKFAFAIAAVAIVAAVPASAGAWECNFASCPVQCDIPITYAIGALPADVDEAEGISEIQRAFDDWNAPACVDFQFQYLGRGADLTEPAAIVVSVVPWSDQLGGANSWAIAFTSTGQDGCIVPSSDADIGLNDDDWTWSTDGSADFMTTADLYTVVLGRIGSQLGIANSNSPNTVVNSTDNGIANGIGSADEDAVCWLYADGDVAPGNVPEVPNNCVECSADTDCAAGQVCLDSVCLQPCGGDDPMCPGDSECIRVGGLDGGHCLITDFAAGTLACPDDSAPVEDMGTSDPDMGTSAADMGSSDGPDVGESSDARSDMGMFDGLNEETVGGGGCSATGTMPLGPGLLLLVGFLVRRRRD